MDTCWLPAQMIIPCSSGMLAVDNSCIRSHNMLELSSVSAGLLMDACWPPVQATIQFGCGTQEEDDKYEFLKDTLMPSFASPFLPMVVFLPRNLLMAPFVSGGLIPGIC